MSEPRLKTAIWVQAMLRSPAGRDRFGVVLRRGDDDAGSVLLVLRGALGLVVLSQTRDAEGAAAWLRATGPDPVAPGAADGYVARQVSIDPDLWVVEFEAPDLLPPFEANILA